VLLRFMASSCANVGAGVLAASGGVGGGAAGPSLAALGAESAPAALRNREPIREVLARVLPTSGTVLTIAEGSVERLDLGERWFGGPDGALFNGRPARVSAVTRLAEAQIYTSSPDFFQPDEWPRYDALSRRCLFRRFGGDCYQYGLLASGHCDLVVETSLKTFDFMALIPVVEGAGGLMRDWSGAPLTPDSDGRVVAAATPALMEQALEALQ